MNKEGNKAIYSAPPKCQHILSTTPSESDNNTLISTHTHATRTLIASILCKCIALSGHAYCQHHISKHAEDYARYKAEQNAKRKTSDGDDTHATRTLSTLLTKLTNKTGAYESKDIRTIIALLRKDIDKRDEMSKRLTQAKVDTLLTHISELLDTYAPDKRKEIGAKLLSIAQEYSE